MKITFAMLFAAFLLLLPMLTGATGQDSTTAYVSSNGKDSNAGTAQAPFATIAKAVAMLGNVGGTVKVTAGLYDGPVVLRAGITIEGGYDPGFKATQILTDDQLRSGERSQDKYPSQTRLVNSQGDRVVTADDIKGEAQLNNVVILGPDQSSKSGQSSYGVVVQGEGTVHLKSVKLIVGNGGPGIAGTAGAAATGLCTAGGPGGVSQEEEREVQLQDCVEIAEILSCVGPTIQFCESQPGNQGATVRNASGDVVANGGSQGAPGPSSCYEGDYGSYRNASPDNGGLGGDGDAGLAGTPGTANDDQLGAFRVNGTVLRWVGQPGGSGGVGFAGAGGGGGGAGGSHRADFTFCKNVTLLGGNGGAGGQGGCGGGGGQGGQAGGAAFGIVIRDARVATESIGILGGTGGSGGAGGVGGAGAPGSSGSQGQGGQAKGCFLQATRQSGGGGTGGAGGGGGQGGGGSGGNGGPSVAVALIGSGKISHTGKFIIGGGAGGTGGSGGTVGGKIHGSPGHSGFSAQQQSFRIDP